MSTTHTIHTRQNQDGTDKERAPATAQRELTPGMGQVEEWGRLWEQLIMSLYSHPHPVLRVVPGPAKLVQQVHIAVNSLLSEPARVLPILEMPKPMLKGTQGLIAGVGSSWHRNPGRSGQLPPTTYCLLVLTEHRIDLPTDPPLNL